MIIQLFVNFKPQTARARYCVLSTYERIILPKPNKIGRFYNGSFFPSLQDSPFGHWLLLVLETAIKKCNSYHLMKRTSVLPKHYISQTMTNGNTFNWRVKSVIFIIRVLNLYINTVESPYSKSQYPIYSLKWVRPFHHIL